MKCKIAFVIVLAVIFSSVLSCTVTAETPYETYSYSYTGQLQISPDAYNAEYSVSEFGDGDTLKYPEDIVYDKSRDYLIIADAGNDRVIVLDSSFAVVASISDFDNNGAADKLNNPCGVFITDDGYLYIADSDNQRILIFNKDFKFLKELPKLSADILPSGFTYKPKAVAVDNAKNVYVISENTNMGVISLNPDGSFQGFIGAQKATVNLIELIKQQFMTEEQLERTSSFAPVEFSNLSVDEKGFVYATSSQIDRYELYNSIWSRSNSSDYAPIKKINASGTDVLKRNGFFPPVGDVSFGAYASEGKDGDPSEIIEITLLDNGMYLLVDAQHNKMFFYDSSGNLLYAFGGEGDSVGVYTELVSVAYNAGVLYALDSYDGSVTVLRLTEYGQLINEVVGYQENREFEKAKSLWSTVISKNNNLDIAYLGLGKICMEKKEYKQAMEYFKLINNRSYYGKAFKLYRQEFLDKYAPIIFVIIIAAIFLLVMLTTKVSRYNNKLSAGPPSRRFRDRLIFAFYPATHPIKGFYEIKVEKRGDVKVATLLWILTGISSIFSTLGASYLTEKEGTVTSALTNTLLPMILWCVANMCFTTLMDGKGKISDIYTAVGYSMVPYITVMIPSTLLGYVLTVDELGILTLFTTVATYWSVALIVLSMMTVHDYSFVKNLAVSILTVVGMAFIIFIMLVFFSLTAKVVSLVVSIVSEISYRS